MVETNLLKKRLSLLRAVVDNVFNVLSFVIFEINSELPSLSIFPFLATETEVLYNKHFFL